MSALSPRAEVLPRSPAASVAGECPRRGALIADSELAARALEVADSQAVSSTRDTYASTYAAFVAFVHARTGCPPRMRDFDRVALIAYRDHLAGSGRSSATIAKQLSALRTLAGALALDPAIAQVKSKQVPRPAPRSLTVAEYNGLVALPKLNARRGRRDHAILRVLGECGLRRSELVELTYADIEPAPRLEDPELRRAMARAFGSSTIYVLRIRDAKTPDGARTVPLSPAAHAALDAWTRHRPARAASDHIFLSLPKHPDLTPAQLTSRSIGNIVGRFMTLGGIDSDRRGAHTLRHTFCTRLSEAGVAIEVIAKLAGHADIRTTQRYINVTRDLTLDAIGRTFGRRSPFAADLPTNGQHDAPGVPVTSPIPDPDPCQTVSLRRAGDIGSPPTLAMSESSELIDRLRLGIDERLEQVLAEAQRLRRGLAALDTGQGPTPIAKRRATSAASSLSATRREPTAITRDSAAAGATKTVVLGALAAGDPVTAWQVAAATCQARATVLTSSPGSRRAVP